MSNKKKSFFNFAFFLLCQVLGNRAAAFPCNLLKKEEHRIGRKKITMSCIRICWNMRIQHTLGKFRINPFSKEINFFLKSKRSSMTSRSFGKRFKNVLAEQLWWIGLLEAESQWASFISTKRQFLFHYLCKRNYLLGFICIFFVFFPSSFLYKSNFSKKRFFCSEIVVKPRIRLWTMTLS